MVGAEGEFKNHGGKIKTLLSHKGYILTDKSNHKTNGSYGLFNYSMYDCSASNDVNILFSISLWPLRD